MSRVSTYVPSEASCMIMGVEMSGYDSDSFITITPLEDRAQYKQALDGSVTIIHRQNQVFEIEVKLVKTSPSNMILQLLLDMQLRLGVIFPVPLYITGGGVGARFFSMDTVVKVEPTSGHGSTVPVNTWRFLCFNSEFNERGSPETESEVASIVSAISTAVDVMNVLGIDPSTLISQATNQIKNSNVGKKVASTLGGLFE